MGYDDIDDNDDDDDWSVVDKHDVLQVTNLLPGEFFLQEEEEEVDDDDDDEKNQQTTTTTTMDPWTENANNIRSDIERMALWIHSKKWLFISFDSMEEAEASLIQSTVTSFAATTVKEIESLRAMAATSTSSSSSSSSSNKTTTTTTNDDVIHHRTGIVQILLARLKEEIVEPFGILQKHRSREAVRLWQNPLQCKLLVKRRLKKKKKKPSSSRDGGGGSSIIDQALMGLDEEDDEQEEALAIEQSKMEQRFLPSRDSHQFRNRFMDTYRRDQNLPKDILTKRPKSLIRDSHQSALSSNEIEAVFKGNNNNNNQQDRDGGATTGRPTTATMTGFADYQLDEMSQEQQDQMMQQEAMLLQAMVHSDLDSVQKMEQQMVSITTLLTQFSELVSEQQEEVWNIHDKTKETKSNMEAGKDQLIDAAEKTNQSNHYMAKGIFAMGCLLLLFHWLRP